MCLTPFPEPPKDLSRPEDRAELTFRYEDVSQQGFLTVTSIPHVLGDLVWPMFYREMRPHIRDKDSGVVPILTKLILLSEDGPLSSVKPTQGSGTYQLAHCRGADGEVDKLFVNMWTDIYGAIGTTHGFEVPRLGQIVRGGRIFAEHVMTRPFAPAEERRVRALSSPGLPTVPEVVHDYRPPAHTIRALDHVQYLGDFVADSTAICFGLDHSDSNQHVNSLVYPRFFIDAANRALFDAGIRDPKQARQAECAFRKPFFAGDRARIHLRLYRDGEVIGVQGAFVADGKPLDERAHAALHFRFA